MVMLNEDTIEKVIRENKDKFSACSPPEDHTEKFLFKMSLRIRKFISIVPYLVRVAIATVIIFISSVIIWNNFIRKDRNEISLGKKITRVVDKVF